MATCYNGSLYGGQKVTEALPLPILSVVIPVYREGAHLSATLQEIVSILKGSAQPFEVVLVDDGSPDDTWDTILQQKDRFEQVQGVRLSRHFGKEAALAAGLELASGSAILVMDGDLQQPPASYPRNDRAMEKWDGSRRGREAIAGEGKIHYACLRTVVLQHLYASNRR